MSKTLNVGLQLQSGRENRYKWKHTSATTANHATIIYRVLQHSYTLTSLTAPLQLLFSLLLLNFVFCFIGITAFSQITVFSSIQPRMSAFLSSTHILQPHDLWRLCYGMLPGAIVSGTR